MLPQNVLYYGKEEPLPERQQLRAGPLSLLYEEGDLRYIRLGDQEIVRRIYVAVRDRNWGTVQPVLSNVQVQIGADSFRITYDVENQQGEIDFFWQGAITGDARGTITFTMNGEARSSFVRNRIGFCILHPNRECAGHPCAVEHSDGSVEQGEFPRHISPHQPFMDMRAITHEVIPGVKAEVRFEGDIFEMEDQRNWTDASYKTYCTPLALPCPVEIQKGTRVSQSCTLSFRGSTAGLPAERTSPAVVFTIHDDTAGPLPRIGLGVASHGQPLNERELARLKALNLSHLRVDLDLSGPDYPSALRRAAAEARALGVSLEIALMLTDRAGAELRALASLLEEVKPPVGAWLIFHAEEKSTSEMPVRLAREHLTGYDPKASIGAGSNAYFTEVNRGRPPVPGTRGAGGLDLVAYSINPQVHAFDNASLVETLEAQGVTVESARQFAGGALLAASPITLQPRFNPNATGPEPEPAPGELPSQVDVRQMSLLGAGWTAGSLKYLAESGLHSATYYETTGWRGVMETETGAPTPEKFRSLPGSVFPLYHVLADVGEFAGGEAVPSRSSRPLQVDGLVLRREGETRVLLANLSPEPQQVRIEGLGRHVRVRHLNETNVEDAMRSPEAFRSAEGDRTQTAGGKLELKLLPFALARIDSSDTP
jgi:hypothetical protein